MFVLKKLISISLILSIVLPFWVSFFMLNYERGQIKREIKQKLMHAIDKSELVLLKFAQEEVNIKLRWEHSREFEYEGEMYDIVDVRVEDDFIYYWCWEDKEETTLNKKLEMLVLDHTGFNKKNKRQTKHLSNYLSTLFFNSATAFDFNQPERMDNYSNIYIDNYTHELKGPEPPPPQSC